jgi:DNA polymerase III epsilon subunit-like protein
MAHNINFDINVLRAELYRYRLEYIIELLDTKTFFCTMLKTKKMVNATFKNSNDIKDPNLKELYFYATGKQMENHHNSFHDTQNLYIAIKILKL